jgi:cytidylate kinase
MLVCEIPDLQYHGSICVSGLTAAGKSVHSHLLAGELGLTYVSGSQILLNLAGVSPIQRKDFWVTAQARQLKAADGYRRIDEELLRIESTGQGFVFDTSTQPWRHRQPALCVWRESDVASRVRKSLVSHRGRGHLQPNEYEGKINEKDGDTIGLCRELYGISIGSDLKPFHLVLDISETLTASTLDASLKSIARVHRILRPAALWYLTGRDDFESEYRRALESDRGLLVHDGIAALVRGRS